MHQNYATLGDIYGPIARFSKNTSSSFQTMIVDEINRAMIDAANQHNWAALRRVETSLSFSVTSSFLYLPAYVGTIIAIVDGSVARFIEPSTLEYLAWQSPTLFGNAGAIIQWADAGDAAYQADMPATQEALNIVSSSSSDTSQSVRITGRNTSASGIKITEEVILNGQTNVLTGSSYIEIDNVSIDATKSGVITYTGATTGTVYGKIAVTEKMVRYKRIRLLQPPATGNSIVLIYEKIVNPLVNDNDVVELPISTYLRERGMATALQYDENWAAAQQHLQLAEQALQKAIENDGNGADEAIMSRPWIRPKMSTGRYTIGRPGG